MRRRTSWVVTGILVAASATALGSEGSTPMIDGLSGQASLGGSYSGRDEANARFREYWNGMHSMFGVEPSANLRYEFNGENVPMYAEGSLNGRTGLEGDSHDGTVALAAGSYGLFRVRGSFTRIGHQFAHDAHSLFAGAGTGTLTVEDSLQSALWDPSTVNRANILTTYYNNASLPIDLGFRRDQVRAGVDLAALEPVSVSFDLAGEQRRGTRPRGASLGSPGGASVEIPEPIDYDTVNVSARVGYEDRIKAGTDIPVAASVAAAHSSFQNNIEAVLFDNPLLLSDSSTGAGHGRLVLPPTNTADSVAGDFSTRLPHRVGLSGHASLSRFNQDTLLEPATVNSFIAPQITVPRTNAEARVLNTLYAGALTYEPVSRLDLKLGYRYRSHRNDTAEYIVPKLAVSDTSVKANAGAAEYVSYIERTTEFEQIFEVTNRTHITTAFENEHGTFADGSASRITQNQFKVAVDTRALDWATFKVSGEHAVRESDYPDYTAADSELPWMRKFYAADRDRDQVTIITTIAAAEDLDLMIEHVQGMDDYKHSSFGLQKDDHRASTIDLTYEPGDGLSMSTFVSQEAYTTRQQSRQWTATLGNPYTVSPGIEDPGNWTLDSTTVVNTIGMTTALDLVPDKLAVRLDGTASAANGKLEFGSPFSNTWATGSDPNSFLPIDMPSSDETQWVQGGLSVTYQVLEGMAATLGYRYDLWRINDGLRSGYTPIAVNGTGAFNNLITMDSLFKNYEVHTVYARVSKRF